MSRISLCVKNSIKNAGLPIIPLAVGEIKTYALIDTGADHNLIDYRFLNQIKYLTYNNRSYKTFFGNHEKIMNTVTFPIRLDHFISELHIEASILKINNLDAVSKNLGEHVTIILGCKTLSLLNVTIDLSTFIITFDDWENNRNVNF